MKSKKWLAGILVAVVGASAFTATAIAKNHRGGHGERMVERISQKLSLDEGQTAALQALQVEIKETRDAMSNDHEATKAQFTELLSADSFDQDIALQMINERINAVQNNAPDLVSAAAVFLDGLNSEQKSQIQQFMDKKGKRHGHSRQNSDQ